jgi:hypothetical protein
MSCNSSRDPYEPTALPAAIDSAGRLLASLHDPGAGLVIAVREAFGAIDGWHEYLCAFCGDWGFNLNVYRYEWLGELPEDWLDDDGELLPEHRDDDGELKLPETWDYRPVMAYRYGGFIGELVPAYGTNAVQISDCSAAMVGEALQVLRWPESAVAEVRQALLQLSASYATSSAPGLADEGLRVSHYSIVIKREAVGKRFPGGTEEFDRIHEPARSNGALSILVRMSLLDADLVFQKLHSVGLVPQEDFGLVDMQQGVLVPCHGIRGFGKELAPLVMAWSVQFDDSYRYQSEDVALEWQPPEPKRVSVAQPPLPGRGRRRVTGDDPL